MRSAFVDSDAESDAALQMWRAVYVDGGFTATLTIRPDGSVDTGNLNEEVLAWGMRKLAGLGLIVRELTIELAQATGESPSDLITAVEQRITSRVEE